MAFDMGKKKGVAPSMNVTPLVDVVLVLLIIFMVVTPLLAKQMSVRVPVKSDADAGPADVALVLVAKRDGTIALNQAPVSENDLAKELEALIQSRPDRLVFFSAEDGVSYGAAVAVLDRAKQSGATLAVLTEPLR